MYHVNRFPFLMAEDKEVLAGGYRMSRVRKTKAYLYLVQVITILAVIVFLITAEGGFSVKPFYLPINSFIYFLILMLLLFTVENFFFKALEMRFSRTPSSKYYIAKLSMRRSMIIIVIAAFVILLLWLPPISQAIEDSLSDSGEVVGTKAFYNKDFLGLTTTDSITLSASGEAYVYVVAEQHYIAYADSMDQLRYFRINAQNYVVNPTTSFEFPQLDYGKYYFVLDDRYSTTISAQYTIHQNLSPTFLSFVPLFALLFIVVNVGWLIYITPQMKKFAEKAIYQ